MGKSSATGNHALALADVTARPRGNRIAALDVARGVAIAAMIVYHFAWDLWAFGFVTTDVGHGPGWTTFAHAIATTFLFIVGASLVLATRHGFDRDAFLWRLGMVAGGALLTSIGTWFIDADTFVFFGILHLIALGSVLVLPFLWLPAPAAAIAAVVVIWIGNAQLTVVDAPWLAWLGLSREVHATVDYYPVFPWLGAILAGVAVAQFAVGLGFDRAAAAWRPADPISSFLAVAGRWSLVIYLLHQLVLFPGVWLAASLLLPPQTVTTDDPAGVFMDECIPAVLAQGNRDLATSTTYCACMYAGITGTDILGTPANRLSDEQRGRVQARTQVCARALPPPAATPILPN